jgi:hypothetical protein
VFVPWRWCLHHCHWILCTQWFILSFTIQFLLASKHSFPSIASNSVGLLSPPIMACGISFGMCFVSILPSPPMSSKWFPTKTLLVQICFHHSSFMSSHHDYQNLTT